MDQLRCPSCRERKPRRACPALGATICTVCCATKRQVEIACPADCVYLTSARSHPPAVVQRRQERDVAFILPLVSDSPRRNTGCCCSSSPPWSRTPLPHRLPFAMTTLPTRRPPRQRHSRPHGKASFTSTRRHRAGAAATSALAKVVADLGAQAGSHQARLERDGAVVLRRIEQGARTAATALARDEPPAYLNLLIRMLKDPAAPAEAGAGPSPGAGGGLIITP